MQHAGHIQCSTWLALSPGTYESTHRVVTERLEREREAPSTGFGRRVEGADVEPRHERTALLEHVHGGDLALVDGSRDDCCVDA